LIIANTFIFAKYADMHLVLSVYKDNLHRVKTWYRDIS